MKKTERRDSDLEITIELPIKLIQDHHINRKDPKRIVFPLVSKIGISIAVILSVILIAHALFTHFFNNSISLIDESSPVFAGNNGSGTVDDSFQPQTKAIQELEKRSDAKEMQELIDSISCSFDASTNLSNGMTVTYACSYNTDLSDDLDVSFKNTSRSYTVMGLSDQEALDPFEDLDVEYQQDENGYTLILVPDEKYTDMGIDYSYTYESEHSIRVTIDYDQDALYDSGYYIPEKNSEKIIDIPEILSIDQISQDTLQNIQNTLLSKAENELHACDSSITFGKQAIFTSDPVFESFQKNDDGTYDAVIKVSNIYSLTLSDYYHFSISYHGYFMQDTDGTISFITEDTHGCTYDGFASSYEIQKNDH